MVRKFFLYCITLGIGCSSVFAPLAHAATVVADPHRAPHPSAAEKLSVQINFPKEEALGTINVKGMIAAPPEKVWALVVDIHKWHTWMPMVQEATYLSAAAAKAIPADAKKDKTLFDNLRRQFPGTMPAPAAKGRTTRVSYEAYDLPWPISNEWLLRRYVFDASRAEQHVYKVSWTKVYDPQEPGSDGYWLVEPLAGDSSKSQVTYHFRVGAKRGITLALLKAGTRSAVEKLYHAIRAQAQ